MTAPDLLGNITRTPREPASNVLVALTAAGSVLVAGAGIATAAVFGSGGARPADVLPRNAVGVVTVDLDPATDQKVAAYRLGRKFPDLKVGSEDSVLSDLLKQALESSDDVDYEKDVEPWLGKRIGVAAVPDGKSAAVVVAVQVTDRDKAEVGLKKLAASGGEDLDYAFVEGEDYAILAESDAEEYAAADEHLSDNSAYVDAVDKLDGNQIITAWADLGAAYALAPEELRGQTKQKASGFVVAGLHLDSSYAEITGRAIDVVSGEETTAGRGKVGLVQKLPADTIAATGVTGLDDAVKKMLADQEGPTGQLLGGFEESLGLTLSEDLPAAFGKETALAVLDQNDKPAFVARTRTDDAERALAAVQRVLAQTLFQGAPDGLARAQELVRRTPDGLAAGSDPAAVDRVMADGELGKSATFREAVPDADDAGGIVYVDIARALALAGQDIGEQAVRNTEHLKAVGVSASSSDGGNGSFRLRVTFR